jgi:ribosomal protein S18 acetylase RimI-like enzyme
MTPLRETGDSPSGSAHRAGFGRYLDGLAGSWRGLAAARPSALVVESAGLLALRHPDPVLANAVLLDPQLLADALGLFAESSAFAVWTLADDEQAAAAVRAAGLLPDTTTRPMLRPADLPPPPAAPGVELDVDPSRVCRLNGVDPGLLSGVPGLRCVATADDTSGLVVQDVGEDVVLSFVATRPQARGRGRATAVTTAALRDAAERGRRGAVLQATPAAERMYARLGFVAVGQWQEWVPPGPPASHPSPGRPPGRRSAA